MAIVRTKVCEAGRERSRVTIILHDEVVGFPRLCVKIPHNDA
jgi:hypothetical protein